MKAIKKLSKNCTLIIITHDKELLKLVERVVVIKSGEIVEDTKSSFQKKELQKFFLEKRTTKRLKKIDCKKIKKNIFKK